MSPSTTTQNANDLAALQAGLAEAQRRGPRLSATKRRGATRIRAQLFLSVEEHTALGLVGSALALHMGRPISRALTTRLALYRLVNDTQRSLTDPALAARLKAEMLMDVRDGRIKAAP